MKALMITTKVSMDLAVKNLVVQVDKISVVKMVPMAWEVKKMEVKALLVTEAKTIEVKALLATEAKAHQAAHQEV